MLSKIKNKKGVFGLSAVQVFFASILGIALLAFVIVIIMGTLQDADILVQSSGTTIMKSPAYINQSGYTLTQSTVSGFANPSITGAYGNETGGRVNNTFITAGNYTLTGNVLTNASVDNWKGVSLNYTYKYNSVQQNGLNDILTNTSTGITGFFSSVSPVYAILAVLVIILVLVVLVRVVQAPERREASVQL